MKEIMISSDVLIEAAVDVLMHATISGEVHAADGCGYLTGRLTRLLIERGIMDEEDDDVFRAAITKLFGQKFREAFPKCDTPDDDSGLR